MAWIKGGQRFLATGGTKWEAVEDSDDANQTVVAVCIGLQALGPQVVRFSDVTALCVSGDES